jgi:hypothetical protein
MGGGNLSLQVHPLTEYIRTHFGMSYTQDESYYLLDAGPDAAVYLGAKTGAVPREMESDLRRAQEGVSCSLRRNTQIAFLLEDMIISSFPQALSTAPARTAWYLRSPLRLTSSPSNYGTGAALAWMAGRGPSTSITASRISSGTEIRSGLQSSL